MFCDAGLEGCRVSSPSESLPSPGPRGWCYSPMLLLTCGPMGGTDVSGLAMCRNCRYVLQDQHLKRDPHSRSLLRQKTWEFNFNEGARGSIAVWRYCGSMLLTSTTVKGNERLCVATLRSGNEGRGGGKKTGALKYHCLDHDRLFDDPGCVPRSAKPPMGSEPPADKEALR